MRPQRRSGSGTRDRRGRQVRVLSAAVLAFSFALTVWPCCAAFAHPLLERAGLHQPGQHYDGATHVPERGRGPCTWIVADAPAFSALAPLARVGFDIAYVGLATGGRAAPVHAPAPRHPLSSRGPPGPRYLELLRLLL